MADAAVSRRCRRLLLWAKPDKLDPELLSGVDVLCLPYINEFTSKWRLCGQQCTFCYLKCVLSRYPQLLSISHYRLIAIRDHSDPHNCLGSHKCDQKCSHCVEQYVYYNSCYWVSIFASRELGCGDVAGHNEHHNCKIIPHVCTHACPLVGFLGCNDVCYKLVDHKDEHKYSHNTSIACMILTLCLGVIALTITAGNHAHYQNAPIVAKRPQILLSICMIVERKHVLISAGMLFRCFRKGNAFLCVLKHTRLPFHMCRDPFPFYWWLPNTHSFMRTWTPMQECLQNGWSMFYWHTSH